VPIRASIAAIARVTLGGRDFQAPSRSGKALFFGNSEENLHFLETVHEPP
jgi:hypothetical protein